MGQAVHAFAAKVGDDGTTTTHTCRQGSVDATPGACASGLHLVGQADHIFAAPAARQVDAGGSVDATPRQLAQFHKYPVLRLLFAQVSGSEPWSVESLPVDLYINLGADSRQGMW